MNRELHCSGAFIFDGLHELWSLKALQNTDEVFQILYNFSVGFERLLKIIVVLSEFTDNKNQNEFEKSLITHNHLELLKRVKIQHSIHFQPKHHSFLQMLSKFYKTFRYDRFSLRSVSSDEGEADELILFIKKYLPSFQEEKDIFGQGPQCDLDVKLFISKICENIAVTLYKKVVISAETLSLFTYELRYDSKAGKIFLSEDSCFVWENLLWKELLIYFASYKDSNAKLKKLFSLEPLEFDQALLIEYIQCMSDDKKKIPIISELKELYKQIENSDERFQILQMIE